MQSTPTLRVLVADTSPMFRDGLAALLQTFDHMHVETRTSSAEDALDIIGQFSPDVILLDVLAPDVSLLDLVPRLRALCPLVGLVAMADSADDPRLLEAVQAGVVGYVLRASDRHQLLEAVMNAAQGRPYLPPSVATRVLTQLGGSDRQMGPAQRAHLTPLEHHMLKLMTNGQTNREIAEDLRMSERTVARRLSQIYAKLLVEDRSSAILKAIKYGIVNI
ncbi:MAG: response regulator [Chloroflexota bacterium]